MLSARAYFLQKSINMNKEELKNLTDEARKLSQEGKWGVAIAKWQEIAQLSQDDDSKTEAKAYFHFALHRVNEQTMPYQSAPATQSLPPPETVIAPLSPPLFTYYPMPHPSPPNEKKEEYSTLKMVLAIVVVVGVIISIAIAIIAGLLLYYFSDWKEFITFLHELADVWVKLEHPPSSP